MTTRIKNLLSKLEKELKNTPYAVQNGYADVSGEKYTELLENTIEELKKVQLDSAKGKRMLKA